MALILSPHEMKTVFWFFNHICVAFILAYMTMCEPTMIKKYFNTSMLQMWEIKSQVGSFAVFIYRNSRAISRNFFRTP